MAGCDEALGVQSLWIADAQFTASSLANLPSDPSRARLHSDGAWVPAGNDVNPILQIQLQSVANVSGIALQGHPKVEQWVKTFTIRYSLDGENWVEVRIT